MNNSGRIGRRVLALVLAAMLLMIALPISALAAKKPVTKTVYFTLTNDGRAVVGNDANETVLLHLKVEVPYFDLGAYGLQDYYRYESEPFEQGGRYVGGEVVEAPTALHTLPFSPSSIPHTLRAKPLEREVFSCDCLPFFRKRRLETARQRRAWRPGTA